MKKAALHNLGCKVNGYETEAMQKLLEEDGYEIVSFHEKADVYVINTCTVTNIADRKSRQMLHRARKLNPDAVIVAAGCYVQAQEEAGTKIEGIDILIGNNQKKNLIALLHDYEQHEDVKAVIDINHTGEFEELCGFCRGSYKSLHQNPGWVQPVLYLLYYSVCTGKNP